MHIACNIGYQNTKANKRVEVDCGKLREKVCLPGQNTERANSWVREGIMYLSVGVQPVEQSVCCTCRRCKGKVAPC